MNFPLKPPFFLDFPVRYDKSPDGNGLFVKPMWFMVLHGGTNMLDCFQQPSPGRWFSNWGRHGLIAGKFIAMGLGWDGSNTQQDKTLEYCITVHTWHTFNDVFALFVLAFFTTVISNGLDEREICRKPWFLTSNFLKYEFP